MPGKYRYDANSSLSSTDAAGKQHSDWLHHFLEYAWPTDQVKQVAGNFHTVIRFMLA